MIDTINTKEEKLNFLSKNSVSLLWLDNPYIDCADINTLYNSVSSDRDYTLITICPKSETHYLIRKFYQRRNKGNSLLEKYFGNYYFINVNAYSSIRYLLNNIILLCDWNYYTNDTEMKDEEKYENCLMKRLLLIKKLFYKNETVMSKK